MGLNLDYSQQMAMPANRSPTPARSADSGDHISLARRGRWSVSLSLWGLAVTVGGVAGLVLARPVGRFVYTEHHRMPQQISEEIYPTVYSQSEYEDQFQIWAYPPSLLLIVCGIALIVVALLPATTRGLIASKKWDVALWSIAAAGVLFRLRALLEQRSLWLDEVFLAHNFRDKSFVELFSESLDYSQSAPPGFLLFVWAITTIFGLGEISLRLTPFLFGAGAVVLAVPVGRKLFESHPAQLAFTSLIAFSPVLIYYSQELKQYSVDAFATVVALWLVANWKERSKTWSFGLIGFGVALISLTAVFSLFAAGVVILVGLWQQERSLAGLARALWARARVIALWLAGGLLHGLYILIAPPSLDVMKDFWSQTDGFAPDPAAEPLLQWIQGGIYKLVWMSFAHPKIAAPYLEPPDRFVEPTVLILLLGVLLTKWRPLFGVVLVATGLSMAMLEIYPFTSRLNLYLVPVVAYVFGLAISSLQLLTKRFFVRGTVTTALMTPLIVPLAISLIFFGRPNDGTDMKWLAEEFEQRSETGDVLASADELIYSWYRPNGPLNGATFLASGEVVEAPEQLSDSTVWIIATHYSNEAILDALERTHAVACDTSIRWSSLVILVPKGDPSPPPDFCEFFVPKF
jgi:hypothetical protein